MVAQATDVGELVGRINDAHGLALRVVSGFQQGETRTAHLLRDRSESEWVLKFSPASPGSPHDLRRLVALVDSLRRDGYPAPAHLAVGVTDTVAYWIQERLPGKPMHSSPRSVPTEDALLAAVPTLLGLIELQAGRGDLANPPWPEWLLRTLEAGGDGYCLHHTMELRADTAAMLATIKRAAARCREAPVPSSDIVHFDLSYANILSDGVAITGVIDWNVPFAGALQGDRGFDIATLLFYAYDRPATRQLLSTTLFETSPAIWACGYLAHLTLRQVEWARRFYGGSYEEARFLAIGTAVLADMEEFLR